MTTQLAASLALTGGPKAVTEQAPAWPVVEEQEIRAMEEVVRSGKWSWLGPNEMAFCEEYARFIGTKHCLCLANGTVTLQCALQAVGVEPGDEVIVPGLTWVATAQAAIDIGANVVFVDVDPETCCISPEAFEAAITTKTKAVIPVHLYGCMCDMDAVMAIARKHGLKVVEDVAHQHGSQWRDTRAGAIGDAGSFSFQQSKILTSGEGGAVTCNDDEVYETCFALKQVGWKPDPNAPAAPGKPPGLVYGNRYGHNYRITELQAVLLRAGLARLPGQNRKREENAKYIAEALAAMGGPLRPVRRDPRVTTQAYYRMTLYFDASQSEEVTKEQYVRALQAEGAGLSGSPYTPVYRHPLLNLYDRTSPIPYRNTSVIQDYAALRLPNCERVFEDTGLFLGQDVLLGDRPCVERQLDAIRKVNDSLKAVKTYFDSHPIVVE